MAQALKLFNGRLGDYRRGYIAALSQADAVRIAQECIGGRGWLGELREYWHEGGWGNAMIGVTPRRGMFAETKDGQLVELLGIARTAPLERDDPQAWEAHQNAQKADYERRDAQRQKIHDELNARLRGFAEHYILPMPKGEVVTVEFRGHRYEIREVE